MSLLIMFCLDACLIFELLRREINGIWIGKLPKCVSVLAATAGDPRTLMVKGENVFPSCPQTPTHAW